MVRKVITLDEMERVALAMRARGQRLVLTNGCFELLHVGHIRYLQSARELGDALVVGLNSDASVRTIKGAPRPLVPQEERAELLAALGCVDYVVIFSEPTAEALVATLRPDVYVKGGDYRQAESGQQGEGSGPGVARKAGQNGLPVVGQKIAPEMRVVQGYGGKVVILPYSTGHSTTTLIDSILSSYSRPR